MGLRFPTAAAVSALFSAALLAYAADGLARTCPNPTDMVYEVKDDDTLSEIAKRAYCLSSGQEIRSTWMMLAEYNRIPVGPNPHKIFTLTDLCLPQQISAASVTANRCIAPEPAASGNAPVCGDNRREGKEICDGQDLGGLTCESMGLSPGRLTCRADCGGLDATGCLPAVSQKAPVCPEPPKGDEGPCPCADDEPGEPWLRRVVVDGAVGVTVPLVAATREGIHGALFVGEIGVRLTLRWLEIAPRALLVAGAHDIVFNDIDQPQTVLGGGGELSLGVPIEVSPSLRLTPGAEGGLLYVAREIERRDYPFEGQVTEQSGAIPYAGVFFRPEYTLGGGARGFTISLEASVDLVLASLGGNAIYENFNTKVLGGAGYAF